MKWLPWKYVVRRVARARGFVDPIVILSRLHQFAEPSEVAAPLELLRAGVVFHARGLMNSGAIQHNLDWIWPYWVERQFDPHDDSFLPRAFSVTHVNLTHRNWTAVGVPGNEHLPIVDPRGLLTPFWDGWSLDGWVFRNDGCRLIPCRQRGVQQRMEMTDGIAVTTQSETAGMQLKSAVDVFTDQEGHAIARQRWSATSQEPAWLVLSLRPYNPEGVSFVHDIELRDDALGWEVGEHGHVHFSVAAEEHFTSDYKHGDVSAMIGTQGTTSVSCPVGMATAAAAFKLEPQVSRQVELTIPLDDQHHRHWMLHREGKKTANKTPQHAQARKHETGTSIWMSELDRLAALHVPDERFQYLHEAALRTLILHMPGEVYPGPFTYKRFWVRDTVYILNAALAVGMHTRSAQVLPHLLSRQNSRGYFRSQDGEWDSNGQVLWLLDRYCQLTDQTPPTQWTPKIRRAIKWIRGKRLTMDSQHVARGLLPAGFSAEHLGPNDFYFWDDFWSVAGLNSAARMLRAHHQTNEASRAQVEANDLMTAIKRSLERTDYMRRTHAYPAAPDRRMDAGAIGSLVAAYPLQLVAPDDKRMTGTIDFLLHNCLVRDGFFQDMIHSGINPYLTLHIAQTMLRQGGLDWFALVEAIAKFASPTGQWPEAIHPRTLGGCMGDGQHAWAAAEWLMMMRNIFVREEAGSLIIGAGIPMQWLCSDETLSYGPTWTPWGKLKVEIEIGKEEARVSWQATWHRKPPDIRIALHGYHEKSVDMSEPNGSVTMEPSFATPRARPTSV